MPIAGLACWSAITGDSLRAAESSVADAIRGTLPKYDPAIRANHLAAEQVTPPPKNVPADIPVKQEAASEVVTLPRITVRPNQSASEPVVALPRVVVRPPVNDI